MALKKVATNIPEELLREAVKLTGLNQTQSIIAGLEALIAQEERNRLLDLKGKIFIDLDVSKIRKRRKAG